MLRTINSTRPLTFMSSLSINPSLYGIWRNIVTSIVPASLPSQERKVMNAKTPNVRALSIEAKLVFSPLIAKKRGSKSPETKSSSFSNKTTPRAPLGITRPNTKAPKTECVPMAP